MDHPYGWSWRSCWIVYFKLGIKFISERRRIVLGPERVAANSTARWHVLQREWDLRR